MSFTIGSLFDGSGGFPLAAAMCGGTPLWASEVEPYPIAVTRSRFPTMKHLGDITKINGADIDPVDVVTFGSPCQDLSVAGLRKGLKHEEKGDNETTRSGLFMEAVRIIKEMREATNGVYPAFAVWENVPGAFSSNRGEDFRIVLETLIQIVEPSAVMPPVPKKGWSYADSYSGDGWSLAYRVFDAQYLGVPQRRRRIYLVIDFTGGCARKILFEREGLRGYFEAGRSPWQGVEANAKNCIGADDREGENGCIAFHLLQDPIPNSRISPCMGQGNSNGGQASIGVALPILETAGFKVGQGPKARGIGFEHEKSPTIAAESGGNATPAVCIKCYDIGEARLRNPCEYVEVSPTLSARCGTGGNNVPAGLEPICCIDGDKIGKAERAGGSGLGIRDGDKMYTLTAKDAGQHAVAFQTYQKVTGPLMANSHPGSYTGQDAFSDMLVAGEERCIVFDKEVYQSGQNATGGHYIAENGPAPTLRTTGSPPGVCVRYIVRRLTPIECARLQGFADRWGAPDHKKDFTHEEYRFWLDIRNTHAAINGKATKDYTKKAMLSWYNKLRADSSEYKLWGNGIALPCALYVMQGIADVMGQQKWRS